MPPRTSARKAAAAATQAEGGVEKKKSIEAPAAASPAKKAAKPTAKPAAKKEKAAAEPAAKKGALAVGDHLPDFSVESDTSTDDKKVLQASKDITNDHGAVIFFYPKANTGGCTKQALGFNENAAKLEKAGYKVFGMSADKPKSQANWKAKYSLTYTLLSDPSYQVLKQLGVTKGEKSIARSHIVIGKGGAVEDVQIGVSPGDSVAKAMETILKSSGKEEEAAEAEAEAAAEEAPGADHDAEKEEEKEEEKPKKKPRARTMRTAKAAAADDTADAAKAADDAEEEEEEKPKKKARAPRKQLPIKTKK